MGAAYFACLILRLLCPVLRTSREMPSWVETTELRRTRHNKRQRVWRDLKRTFVITAAAVKTTAHQTKKNSTGFTSP